MVEAVTLELPEEIAQHAREVTERSGRQVAEVLIEWVNRGAASARGILPLPAADYPIYTP